MAKQKIEVWVDEEDLARIDQVRGLAARSAWAREILHGAVSDERPHHGVPTAGLAERIAVGTASTAQIDGRLGGSKHRHRYERQGEPLRHEKGEPVYLRICSCGDTKEGE